MIETTDAILKHETTNRRWQNNPRDKRFQSSLFTIHDSTRYGFYHLLIERKVWRVQVAHLHNAARTL